MHGVKRRRIVGSANGTGPIRGGRGRTAESQEARAGRKGQRADAARWRRRQRERVLGRGERAKWTGRGGPVSLFSTRTAA